MTYYIQELMRRLELVRETAEISNVMLAQLVSHAEDQGEWYSAPQGSELWEYMHERCDDKVRKFYRTDVIIEKMCGIERDLKIKTVSELIESKSIRSFKKGKMREMGLWHSHHFQASNIPYISNRIFSEGRDRILKKHGRSEEAKKLMYELASAATTGLASDPNFNPTGDWIIFKRHDNKNYYLGLAIHEEGDEEIIRRILPCFQQFPELRDQ